MNEKIFIEFERNGELVPVTSFRATDVAPHETGIVLDGETSAFPRGFAMTLRPHDAGTKMRFKQVQQRLDWLNPRRFSVEATREEGRLRLSGVEADALPHGRYKLDFRVGGLSLKPMWEAFQIKKDGEKTIRLSEKTPKLRPKLKCPVEGFDKHSRRILKHKKSVLDGRSAVDWLEKGKHRDRRKAVVLNILAKLAATPSVNEPLNRLVRYVYHAEMDRVYCAVAEGFLNRVEASFNHDAVIHETHRRLLYRLPKKNWNDYYLRSFREKASSSMQAVVAIPRDGVTDRTHFVDMDIDKGNPGWDLKSLMIHVGELLDPEQTNHIEMHKALARGDTADFVYYDPVKT